MNVSPPTSAEKNSNMKTIIADPNIPCLDLFKPLGELICIPGRAWSAEQIRSADILLTRSVTQVDAALLAGSKVKFVGTATSGFDHIDRDYLDQQGITFSYCPGSNANSVAEYIVAAILATIRADQALHKLRAGIIGCGHVGSRVVTLLQALGIECLRNDPPLQEQTGSKSYCSLDQALACDIVTLHTPLILEGSHPTQNLIGPTQLNKMKADVILINAARGGVIDEQALLQHMQDQPSIKTVIDCWQNEPEIDQRLLEKLSLATPHIAGYSYDGKVQATQMLYRSLCAFLHRSDDLPVEQTGMKNCLDLRSYDDPLDCLKEAVFSSYDIRQDSWQLKQTAEVSAEERALIFDRLRKEYPQRREFYRTEVLLDQPHECIERLGFSSLKEGQDGTEADPSST